MLSYNFSITIEKLTIAVSNVIYSVQSISVFVTKPVSDQVITKLFLNSNGITCSR